MCDWDWKCLGHPEICHLCAMSKPILFNGKQMYEDYMIGTGRNPNMKRAKKEREDNAKEKKRWIKHCLEKYGKSNNTEMG